MRSYARKLHYFLGPWLTYIKLMHKQAINYFKASLAQISPLTNVEIISQIHIMNRTLPENSCADNMPTHDSKILSTWSDIISEVMLVSINKKECDRDSLHTTNINAFFKQKAITVSSHTFDAKKGSSVTLDCTNEHSTTSGQPLSPFKQASANMAPAQLQKHASQAKGQIKKPIKVANQVLT